MSNKKAPGDSKVSRRLANQTYAICSLSFMPRLSFVNRDVGNIARACVFGAGAYEAVVGVLFEYVCSPAGDAADGEDGREEVERDAHLVVGRARVVVNVRVELLLSHHQLAQAFENLEPTRLAVRLAHLLRELSEPDRARVFRLIDAMAE